MQSDSSPLNKPQVSRSPETPVRPIRTDSLSLMHALAEMANIPWGGFKRMVLVLEVDSIPQLYTEGLLQKSDKSLPIVELSVNSPTLPSPLGITNLHNDVLRTFGVPGNVFRGTEEAPIDKTPIVIEDNLNLEFAGLPNKLSHATNYHFCGIPLVRPDSLDIREDLVPIETIHIRKGWVVLCQKCYKSCENDVW